VIKIKNPTAHLQFILIAAALVLFYLLLKPLLIVFLASVVLTYIFYPLYKRIGKHIKYESLSILITLILIVIIFLMPFIFVASQIPTQAGYIFDYSRENIVDRGILDFSCENVNTLKCNAINFITGSGYFDFDNFVVTLFRKITEIAAFIVVRIPNIIIGITLSLFISYFLFRDGKKLLSSTISMLPLDKKSSNKLVEHFGQITHSVVFAHIIVAIAQGALGAIGFYIFGIPSALFWGVIMAIFALIPLVGPAIIWIPASIFLIIDGLIANTYFNVGMGIGLFLYGIFIISVSDNILRVKLVEGRGDVHPLTVLIGIIGGVNLFGLIGIFIGPIALSLLLMFFKNYSRN